MNTIIPGHSNKPAGKAKNPIVHGWNSAKTYVSKHKAVSIIVLVIVVGVVYYGIKKTDTTSAETRYVTSTAQNGTIITSVTGTGQVSASTEITLKPQASGTIVSVPVTDNQSVNAGDLIVALDTTTAQESVQNAKASLESAQLNLAKLEEPPTALQLTQAQDSVTEAQQSLVQAQQNLSLDYNNAFTDISNVYLDLPGVMQGLDNVLYKVDTSGQDNISYFTDLVQSFAPTVTTYDTNAAGDYQTAQTSYNQNFLDYKETDRTAATSTISSLLTETFNTATLISESVKSSSDLLNYVDDQLTANDKAVPSLVTTSLNSLNSYTSTTDSDVSTLQNEINTLINDQNAIINDQLNVTQQTESLQQLQAGPDALDVQGDQLSITQAQNALTQAEDNLDNYYVTAPFAGVVTDITANVGDQSGSSVATLITNAKIAQITLNEVDAAKIAVGQPATLTFSAVPDLTIAGQVTEVDAVGTVSQGVVTYGVQIGFDTTDARIKAGMSVSASIVTGVDQNVLVVPNSAVQTLGTASYVQVFNPALAGSTGSQGAVSTTPPQNVTVQVGDSNNTQTEITSGLTAGEQVVTRTIAPTSGTTVSAATSATSLLGGSRTTFGGGGGGGFTSGRGGVTP